MKKTLLCTALAIAVSLPLAASASPREQGQWYISPMVGYVQADDDRYSDDGLHLGLGLGYVFKENWTVEGSLGYDRFDADEGDGQPLEWRQISVDATVRYLIDMDNAHPYFGLGFGFGRNEIQDSNIDDWGYQIGPVIGFEWDMTDSGAFRFEVGHKYTDFQNGDIGTGFWDTTISVGFTHYFGGGMRHEMAPEEPMAPPPMPPSEPAPAEPPARDLPVSITLNGVNFDFDKCTLRSDAIAILDEAVRVLNSNEIRVELAGHTDSVGSDAYNQKLSECRAKVVADYLNDKGVEGGKIVSVNGYGESKPIDTNDTAEGRARNRRTELNVQ